METLSFEDLPDLGNVLANDVTSRKTTCSERLWPIGGVNH